MPRTPTPAQAEIDRRIVESHTHRPHEDLMSAVNAARAMVSAEPRAMPRPAAERTP